jgi:DNA-binding response OmpR family regulator
MGPSANGRILLVEDDDFMCEALSMGLRSRGFEVEARADGLNVEEVVSSFRPEVLILDLNLASGPDGVSIARRIRNGSRAGVMFISGSRQLDDRLAGFAAGGDDFLVKPFSMEEFFARVEAIRRRAEPMVDVTEAGDVVIDAAAHRVTRAGHQLALTPVEFSLLSTLCGSPGRVFSKVQLLDLVWGYDRFDVNLVEVHIHAIRQKLEKFGPRLIHTVRGIGYVLREEEAA